VNPKRFLPTRLQHIIEREIRRDVGWHVVTVCAVQMSRTKPVAHDAHGLVGEKDVYVGCEHELSTRAPDADVFGDHLEQRQLVAVWKACM
jgi:hypothetical protein